MTAITVAYKSDVKMNADYYYNSHVPMVETLLVSQGLRSAEVRKIVGTPTGVPAPYQIITTLYFDNVIDFTNAMSSNDGRAVQADIRNFYEGTPDIMIGET
jgi:uncharacterized protein (TIGR02118 family)